MDMAPQLHGRKHSGLRGRDRDNARHTHLTFAAPAGCSRDSGMQPPKEKRAYAGWADGARFRGTCFAAGFFSCSVFLA